MHRQQTMSSRDIAVTQNGMSQKLNKRVAIIGVSLTVSAIDMGLLQNAIILYRMVI